ncbi:helix-turn-helix transcriptional regulator [Enterobacter mori]
MEGLYSDIRVILFEPRGLIRSGVCSFLQQNNVKVIPCSSVEHLTEELCALTDEQKYLLVGAGGLGNMLPGLVRLIHSSRKMPLTSMVYLPMNDTLLTKMLTAAGARRCLTEDVLEGQLLKEIAAADAMQQRREYFSPAELNIVLDYAAGMQTRDIANRRKCSYKTVFTFKRNARIRMNIDTHAGWTLLMSHLSQLTSLYD